jgi:hypothetical protein
MAIDRRETTLADVKRNRHVRRRQADTGKSADLIGRVPESH